MMNHEEINDTLVHLLKSCSCLLSLSDNILQKLDLQKLT